MSTPPTPTEARQLIEENARHQRSDRVGRRRECAQCFGLWPCMPRRLADALEAFLPTDETETLAGAGMIAAERLRHASEEGYDAAHDAGHAWELTRAGVFYADNVAQIIAGNPSTVPGIDWPVNASAEDGLPWPWHPSYFKPTGDNIRDLVKAGGLIAAAIDSLLAERPVTCEAQEPTI